MQKKVKLEIKKVKKRIPVPQKPPKVEEDKKKYKRQATRKELQEILKSVKNK